MNNLHTLEEVNASVSNLNLEEAAGKDSIFVEILQYCGDLFAAIMYRIPLNVWNMGKITKDWNDVIMIPFMQRQRYKEVVI